MSGYVIGLNAALTAAIIFIVLLTGYCVGSLAFRMTAAGMRRAAKLNLILLALLGALSAAKTALSVYCSGWLSGVGYMLLFVALIVIPYAAIAVLTVPRLWKVAKIRSAAPDEAANRTKRRMAAEAALVVPVQLLAAGMMLFAVIAGFGFPIRYDHSMSGAAVLFLLTAMILLWRQKIRRRRIHRYDSSSLMLALGRYSFYTAAIGLLIYGMMYTVSTARSVQSVQGGYGAERRADILRHSPPQSGRSMQAMRGNTDAPQAVSSNQS